MEETSEDLYEIEEIEPVKMLVSENTFKYDLKNNTKVQSIDAYVYPVIKFSAKANLNGEIYYQTTHDANNNNEYFIPANVLEEISFTNFKTPRNMRAVEETEFINIMTDEPCEVVHSGYTKKFTTKIDIGDKTYYRTESDSTAGSFCTILSTSVKDAETIAQENVVFQNFLLPRELEIKNGTYLLNLNDGTSCDAFYEGGTIKKFTTKIDLEGETYFRDEENTNATTSCAINAKELSEL